MSSLLSLSPKSAVSLEMVASLFTVSKSFKQHPSQDTTKRGPLFLEIRNCRFWFTEESAGVAHMNMHRRCCGLGLFIWRTTPDPKRHLSMFCWDAAWPTKLLQHNLSSLFLDLYKTPNSIQGVSELKYGLCPSRSSTEMTWWRTCANLSWTDIICRWLCYNAIVVILGTLAL